MFDRSLQRSVTRFRIEEGSALPLNVSCSVEVGVERESAREAFELRSSLPKCIFRKTPRALFRSVERLFFLCDYRHSVLKRFIAKLIPNHREGEAIASSIQLLPF